MALADRDAEDGGSPHSLAAQGNSRLSLLTFEEMAEHISQFESRAKTAPMRSAWANLLSLVTDARDAKTEKDDPTDGAPWSLVSISIEGFQGASRRLALDLNPAPGVTVFHGPNGAGKSTIADGIRTALSGRTGWWTAANTVSSRSSSRPLWEKVNTARDSDAGEVQVRLERTGERLTLSSLLDSGGRVESTTATWLKASGEESLVDMSRTAWEHALAGHPPVFSYADVERRVQQSNDLQQYIQNLLALGGCFELIERRATELGEAAKASKKKLDSAAKVAGSRIEHVDLQYSDKDPSVTMAEISWKNPIEDIDAWLATHGLAEPGELGREFSRSSAELIPRQINRVDEALENLERAPDVHNPRMGHPLAQLYQVASNLASPGLSCPVCGSCDTDWMRHLEFRVANYAALAPANAEVQGALKELKSVTTKIASVADMLDSVVQIPSQRTSLARAREVGASMVGAFDRHGFQPSPEVLKAFLDMKDFLRSADWLEAQDMAISMSQFKNQWAIARRDAVADFVNCWRAEYATAKNYQLWADTQKCLKVLSDHLRDVRSELFAAHASGRVHRLLEDVGITLGGVSVTSLRANVEVNDADGKPLDLAMLSAGQRNAFLLAPLLATADSGPFSFLILDDPVHAFDEIRVDRLASVLADLSEKRRVIVFTHDERLKQHLLARVLDCEAFLVGRDGSDGLISVENTDELWRALLEDADHVLRLAPKVSPTGLLTEAQIIRGICRQALDNALHQFIIRHSLRASQDVEANLRVIDEAVKTADRLDAAAALIGTTVTGSNPAADAKSICGGYLKRWNSASHGGSEPKEGLKLEISTARRACEVLAT